MTTHELCDDILNLCLQKTQLNPSFSIVRFYSVKGIGMHEIESALNTLTNGNPVYLNRIGDIYVLTPLGESFAKNGGFAGQTKRESDEILAKQKRQELVDNVNKSVFDTNVSVLHTHTFQKWATIATIVVAVCAFLISLFNYLRNDEKLPILLLQQQQTQIQREIDSLKSLIILQASRDTVQKTRP